MTSGAVFSGDREVAPVEEALSAQRNEESESVRRSTTALRGLVALTAAACVIVALPTAAKGQASAPAAACDGKAATIISDAAAILGTAGDDVIVGGPGANHISGGGGNDVICAGGGNDVVTGGPGADRIFGASGRDRLDGGSGDDWISGGSGRDRIRGGGGWSDGCHGTARETRSCEARISAKAPVDATRRVLLALDQIETAHGRSHPWLAASIDYVRTSVPIVIIDNTTPISEFGHAAAVRSGCRSGGAILFAHCTARALMVRELAIDPVATQNQQLLIHELAHVYQLTPALSVNPEASMAALEWFRDRYPETWGRWRICHPYEAYADALRATVSPEDVEHHSYYKVCRPWPDEPTPADLEVAAATVTAGAASRFGEYWSDGAQLWDRVVSYVYDDPVPDTYLLLELSQRAFGGVCDPDAFLAARNDVYVNGLDRVPADFDPWADRGCAS